MKPRHGSSSELFLSHLPVDFEEQSLLDEMHALLEIDGDPFSSLSFSPGHFTASALVLSADFRKILLIWHPGFGKWIQPGGHVETEDDDLLSAALRELQEETGLSDVRYTGLIDLDLHRVPPSKRKNQPAHLHYDVRFWFKAKRNLCFASAEHDFRWVELDVLETSSTDGSVLKAVNRLKKRRIDRSI